MSKSSSYEYYAARIATERALANEAADAKIAALHNELAYRYSQLLADLDEQPSRKRLHLANG